MFMASHRGGPMHANPHDIGPHTKAMTILERGEDWLSLLPSYCNPS